MSIGSVTAPPPLHRLFGLKMAPIDQNAKLRLEELGKKLGKSFLPSEEQGAKGTVETGQQYRDYWANPLRQRAEKSIDQLKQEGAYSNLNSAELAKLGNIRNYSSDALLTLSSANKYFDKFDANHDNVLTEDELNSHVDNLKKKLDTREYNSNYDMTIELSVAELFQKNYTAMSWQDGRSGFTKTDLSTLASQDGPNDAISERDIYKGSFPELYRDEMKQKAEYLKWVEARHGTESAKTAEERWGIIYV